MRWLVALALIASACSKSDSGPSCEKVVANMLAVTKSAMPAGHDGMVMQNKQQMLDQCEARKLTADQRTCLATAKDLNALSACTPKPAPGAPK